VGVREDEDPVVVEVRGHIWAYISLVLPNGPVHNDVLYNNPASKPTPDAGLDPVDKGPQLGGQAEEEEPSEGAGGLEAMAEGLIPEDGEVMVRAARPAPHFQREGKKPRLKQISL